MQKSWWHIYVVYLDNHGVKARGTPYSEVYYTGITSNFGRRFGDYLLGRGYSWVNKHWRRATKIPVYVEYCYGTKYEAEKRERQIKNMSKAGRKKLKGSPDNVLLGYKLLKHFVFRKSDGSGEIVIKIN